MIMDIRCGHRQLVPIRWQNTPRSEGKKSFGEKTVTKYSDIIRTRKSNFGLKAVTKYSDIIRTRKSTFGLEIMATIHLKIVITVTRCQSMSPILFSVCYWMLYGEVPSGNVILAGRTSGYDYYMLWKVYCVWHYWFWNPGTRWQSSIMHRQKN